LKKEENKIVENGTGIFDTENDVIDHDDNDDNQWSDWEQEQKEKEQAADMDIVWSKPQNKNEQVYSSTTLPTLPTIKENKTTNNPFPPRKKSSTWDPNAPLGSEYEIQSIKKKANKNNIVSNLNEDDDLFKDMTPNVQTKELLTQLETMFNINVIPPTNPINEYYSKKFTIDEKVINSTDSVIGDQQYQENNWDEG